MKFIFPAFLFGLLSLAIPVIIHLFHLRRSVKVYFSNVQFLKNIQQKESSHRKLKQRLILLTRMFALAFLVLAFAKPYFPSADGNQYKQHAVSIFVDNSYSMQAINREGTLLDEARTRAKELASGYGINDRFQLLTQDFEGNHQRLLSRQEFFDEVDKIKISPNSRTLQQITGRQANLLEMKPDMLKSIYILSDFQKNLLPAKEVKPVPGVAINLVRLKSSSQPNVAIDSVWFLSAVHTSGNSEKLVVTLHNYADDAAEKIPVKLLVNGTQKALGSFTVNPRSIQYDTLQFSGLNAGWQNAEIQVQDNPVTFDNRFYFTFQVVQQMPVLLITGDIPNKYLATVFSTEPFFKLDVAPYGNVDYAQLPAYPFIVISDVKSIPAGLSQQLQTYIKGGGTLAVFPADEADLASYQALLRPMGAGYPEELITTVNKVEFINLQSNLFKNTFSQVPDKPNLPWVRKYYRLNTDKNAIEERIFNMAGKEPFFSGYATGGGHVYLSAVPLHDDYSNLQLHALFVPLMFRMALLSGREFPLFYTIGIDENAEITKAQATDKQLLKLKGPEGAEIIPDVRQQEGNTTRLYFSDQIRVPGIYDLKKGDSIIAKLAFNNNRSESDLSYLSDNELKQRIPGKDNHIMLSGPNLSNNKPAKAGLKSELWKLCLVLSLIFLATEILLVRFFHTAKKAELTIS